MTTSVRNDGNHEIIREVFWWNNDQKNLLKEVAQFVDEHKARELEIRVTREFAWDVFSEVAKRGWFGIVVPKAYGGTLETLGPTGLCIVNEAFGRIFYSTRFYGLTIYGGPWQIVRFGSEKQKERWLPKIARGEYLGAIVMTEPFTGSDAAGMQVTATRRGDRYAINGKKRFISSAGAAHVHMVYCRTSSDPKDKEKYRHLSAFIVEKGTPGLSVEKINDVMGAVGYRNGTLNFEDVEVQGGNMLGKEGDGWRIMTDGLNIERLMVASSCVGGLVEGLTNASRYVNHRVAFKRRLSSQQIIQHKIADMISWIDVARVYTYYAAHLMDTGQLPIMESAIAKVVASERELQGILEAIQCMGGDGVMMYYPVEKFVSSAKISMIGGGTNEILRSLIFREAQKLLLEMNGRIEGYLPKYFETKQLLGDESSLKSKVLHLLAEEYRINPGLHTDFSYMVKFLGVKRGSLVDELTSLKSQGLVDLVLSNKGEIDLVRATYAGLRKGAPSKYYTMIPPWVNPEDTY